MQSLFAQQIVEDISKEMAKNSRRFGAKWVENIQRHPATPVDTGHLWRNIRLVSSTTRPPIKIRVASTGRSEEGFDYPAHLTKTKKHFMWWDTVTGDDSIEGAIDTLLGG